MAHITPAALIVSIAAKAQPHMEGAFTVRLKFEGSDQVYTVNAYFKGNVLSKCAIGKDCQKVGKKAQAITVIEMNTDQFISFVAHMDKEGPGVKKNGPGPSQMMLDTSNEDSKSEELLAAE